MLVNELEIIVGSTVTDAVKGLNQVDKATGKLSTDTNKAAASISKSYTQINNASKILVKSNQQLSGTVVNAGGTLTSFSRIVQDAPFGIIGVGNNITQFAEQFQYLQRQTGSAGTALKALAKSLVGAGGITLGISLLVTGITQLTQKYGSLGNAVDALLFPLSKQQKLQKEVNDTILEGQKDAQKEVAKLETLYRATQNLNIPLAERNKLIDKIQKDYPNYFKNFTNEEILTGKAASAYNRLRDAILKAATARAIEKKIAENQEKLLELDFKRDELLQKVTKTAISAAKAQDDAITASTRSVNQYGTSSLRAGTKAQTLSASIGDITDQLKENGKQINEINSLNDQLLKKNDELATQLGAQIGGDISGKSTEKTKKNIKTISSVLTELQKDITGLNVAFAAMGGSITDLAGDKLQKFKKALQDLSELGVRPGDAVFNQLQGQIDLLQNSLAKTPVTLTIPKLKIVIPKASSNTAEIFKSLVDSFNFDALRLNLERGINDALQNLSLSGIQSIGDAIGGAITGSGGGIQDAIKGFLTLLGGFFQQVGIQLLTYSKVLTGLQIAIKSLNPYVAAIAGGLAIIAGGALKAYASNLPSFATGGGVVGGPTLAMIGDNPGREEYVIPSEVLDKIGGGGSGFIAETRLSGTDILIAVRRAMGNSNRANG